MVTQRIVPQNSAERLVWISLVWMWAFYAIGSLYVLGPALAMILIIILTWKWFSIPWSKPDNRPPSIPLGVWLWIIGMIGMLISLLYVHINDEMGLFPTIKSSIGWLKGWALIALFPLVGACLKIRPEIIIRGISWMSLQTLILIPFLIASAYLHLPSMLYVSPISIVGGPGSEFFSVYLYIVDPSNGAFRWQFMAPWAPAAGMMGNMILIISRYEKVKLLKWSATLCGILMCIMTGSRMSLLFAIIYLPIIWLASKISKPWLLAVLALCIATLSIMATTIIDTASNLINSFRSARINSSRVRETLGRIAVERWQKEAPLWGHGTVSYGTQIVEFMPIGSHHTWYGLLYVKGIVGCVSLFVPMVWTLVEMILFAQVSKMGQLGLSIIFMILWYSFGENLEILSYLMWPLLILLGHIFHLISKKQISL